MLFMCFSLALSGYSHCVNQKYELLRDHQSIGLSFERPIKYCNWSHLHCIGMKNYKFKASNKFTYLTNYFIQIRHIFNGSSALFSLCKGIFRTKSYYKTKVTFNAKTAVFMTMLTYSCISVCSPWSTDSLDRLIKGQVHIWIITVVHLNNTSLGSRKVNNKI